MKYFLTASLLLLAACGFTPLYGEKIQGASAKDFFSQIDIMLIPDREGQQLRNALLDQLNMSGVPSQPRYRLHIQEIAEEKRELDITKEADTTRSQLRLRTSFKLVDLESQQTVLGRSVYAITSYNELASEFSTRVTEQNARDNAITELARQIERDLALYANTLEK
ncbi:MAG: hypothetical protein GC136_03070 [Alphaproteobacteria bacterium]|nr:hypothetical protein [Alphaproteobacteria bacterium]